MAIVKAMQAASSGNSHSTRMSISLQANRVYHLSCKQKEAKERMASAAMTFVAPSDKSTMISTAAANPTESSRIW